MDLAQLPAWLFLSYDSWNSGWTRWLILVIQLIVFAQILRAWIGPSVLGIISRRVQVRRVSLRSVRGVYVRLPSMTIRIDRVGLSYHRPSAQTARRFSLKVEGLWIELHELKVPPRPSQSISRRLSRLPTLADFRPSPMARRIWSTYSAVYSVLEPYVRPILRFVFVTWIRAIIKCLPMLTQVIDCELDRALLTLTTMPEAHVAVRFVTLSTAVEFSGLESVVEAAGNYPGPQRHRRFSSMAHLRTRFANSVKRAWGHAWGRTRGRASLCLKVQSVSGFASVVKWPQLNPDRYSPKIACGSQFAFVMDSSHHADICFYLPDSAEVFVCFEVGRAKRIIREHSILTSLRMPSIEFSTSPLLMLLSALKKLRKGTDSPNALNMRAAAEHKSPRFENGNVAGRRPRFLMASLLRCIEVSIKDISVRHRIRSKDELRPRRFLGHIRSLSLSLEFGEPEKNVLHKDFLGTCPERVPDLDAEILSFSFLVRDLTVQRRSTIEDAPPSKVVSIRSVGLRGFATQWPFLNMPAAAVFPGDPNAALLVVKLNVLAPQFSERVDVAVDVLEYMQRLQKDFTTSREPTRTVRSVPRLLVDIEVEDVSACLTPLEHDGTLASSLLLSSTQCVISISSYFRFFPLARSRLAELQQPEFIPLDVEFTIHSLLGPAFVMVMPNAFSLGGSSGEMSSAGSASDVGGDPLLSLGAFEFVASGETLGIWQDDTDEVVLDATSTIANVKCVTDAISLELWQPSAIFSVRSLLDSGRNLANSPIDHEPGLLKRLPGGITAHFAIGHLVIVITGKDVNPDEDPGLSRGVAVKSGFAVQYCSMHDRRNFSRLPKKFNHAHDRQRLYLSEDLLFDAISMSSASAEEPAKFALFRCIIWDTVFRTSIATEFATDHAYEAVEEPNELKLTEFLWIRRSEINAVSRYLPASETSACITELLQLSVRVPTVQAHVQLFSAYCVLLALTTLRSLTRQHGNMRHNRLRAILISIKAATVTTVQLLLKLPLQEQVCVRINGLVIRSAGANNMIAEWGVLFAWAPSVQDKGKWEELLRLRSWKLACNVAQCDQMKFTVCGEGARLRIPYGYIIADLILDVNLSIKCIKHLVKITSSGVFRPISSPDVEDAKITPVINVQIGCLSLEVLDDPLESKLGLIWRAGFEAARSRLDREEAFDEKVAAIRLTETNQSNSLGFEARFGPQHTVSVEEACERLLLVHSLSWITLHREYRDKQKRNEINIRKEVRGEHFHLSGVDIDPIVPVVQSSKAPPLLRFITTHVKLDVSPPSFPASGLSDFLYDLGRGLPRDTQFTLLIPLHLHVSLGSTCATLRDYPLPLLNVVQDSPTKAEAWVIDMDLVVAEELGLESSVIWRECPVVQAESGSAVTMSLNLSVPKTTMPVKTYANPTVNVLTSQLTEICWCNSYAPALQDIMRILDTLTTPPPDPSPPIGFWDKVRLVFHWRAEFNFANDVHLNLKGSRDPYATNGIGAGFSFCWRGHTKMLVGSANPENELLQVCSDTMLVVIPEFVKRSSDEVTGGGISSRFARGPVSLNQGVEGHRNSFTKICAKFTSGIKWGIGIVLERTCGQSCTECGGRLACRLFDFLPHHQVKLQPKANIPLENAPEDSFFGHKRSSAKPGSSKFHLTPKTFTHFWSWWDLFDRYLSIPIRQGCLFPNARPPSKKFGRHLATIKYRIDVQRLFISHIYMDNTRESWSEGITHCVGVKGLVNSFEADMHQREQEAIVPGVIPNTLKKIRHKPFYAAEVKLTDLQLCATLTTFIDPSKGLIDLADAQKENRYEDIKPDELSESLHDSWFDIDDFVETDWEPPEDVSRSCIFPVASCPRFTYFRRSNKQPHHGSTVESSRFGDEDTHICLMGKEKSVHSLQADIVGKRLTELRESLASLEHSIDAYQTQTGTLDFESESQRIRKGIRQLERHIGQLQDSGAKKASPTPGEGGEYAKYLMPSDISFPKGWTEFDNVYQTHCPEFRLCRSTRDILIQYYYCSRARRGLEYHMAARAVKFIRDQLRAHLRVSLDSDDLKRIKNPTGLAAQVAAQALKKLLIGNEDEGTSNHMSQVTGAANLDEFDPMAGWSNDVVSQNKSHFCLLLKPQLVLRSEANKNSVVILAALQAMLQSHAILDTANIDDPISGRIMTRTHAVLSELQVFSPTSTCPSRHGGVPLEVLLDLRAESSDFDRLVPQTNATFRYDKFNRLRLRNNVTSAIPSSTDQSNSHLQHQTDLIHVHVPRFTVSASSKNFEDIANVITTLLLRSDAVHKMHLNKVKTLLFRYDFGDLSAAADVIESLQSRLRRALDHECDLETTLSDNDGQGRSELMKMKAHIFLLSEDLNLIFDAINLAQENGDDKHNDTKMALKVHTSAREISWGMVDNVGEMIAKLAIRGIEHNWLNRQDGSTVNHLVMADLHAFDGSPDAEWPEILAKYPEPSSHPLVKRGIFLQADWTVLAPVGGITIFEQFILELHPIRLQLEARVGKNIMQYVWPARRERERLGHLRRSSEGSDSEADVLLHEDVEQHSHWNVMGRLSLDVSSAIHPRKRHSTDERRPTLGLPSRRITSSRSFTDLRAVSRQNSVNPEVSASRDYFAINRSKSELPFVETDTRTSSTPVEVSPPNRISDDAAEMKTRSAQKTFVLVRVSSMHILLSFHKDGSFFCRDARIRTRELQYHNQTWSFEELAEQFIPSDTSWRGWMRVALHQPLVPVLPVARELIAKTKWGTKRERLVRQTRKIVKPKPTNNTRKTSDKSDTSESHTHLTESPKSRRLGRLRKSSENDS